MKIRQDFSKNKMNKDLDQRYIPKGEYRDLANGRTIGSTASNVGVIESIRGTLELNIPALSLDQNLIGFCNHENHLYYIATSLSKPYLSGVEYSTVLGRYDKTTGEHQFLLQEDEVGEDANLLLLQLDKDTQIISMQVFGGLLIFCDNKNNEPYKININKLLDSQGYYNTTNDIKLIKAPPKELSIVAVDDTVTDANFMKGEPFQFASRYIYEDGEISAISPYSTTPVIIPDEKASIDGRIGFMMNTLSNSFKIASTEDRFSSLDARTLSVGPGADHAAGISVNYSGTRVVAISRRYVNIVDYSNINSPTFIRIFDNDTLADGRWSGVGMSGDGNTVILSETEPGGNKDLILYKVSNPSSISSTLQEVYTIGSGDDETNSIGNRICMSVGGNVVYACHSATVSKSESFGNQGTWSDVVDLKDISTVETGNREAVATCCSSDGKIVYIIAVESYGKTASNYTSIFRSRNYGADWDEVFFNRDLNRMPTNIDCSSNGLVVAFVTGGDGNNNGDARIYVSNNEGSTFSPRSSSSTPTYLTDITVSTTGSFITAIGRGDGSYAELHQSVNFGESFSAINQTSISADSDDYPVITSVNNEVSTKSLNSIDNIANKINVNYNTGNKHVTDIEVLVKTVTNRVFIIKSINKESEGLGDNETKTIVFRNDGSYIAVPEKDVDKLYDNVPLKARSLEITQNSLIIANYTDGRSLTYDNGTPVTAGMTASVISSPLISGTNKGLKTNSINTYGIVYYDNFQRSSAVLEGVDVSIPSSSSDKDNPVKHMQISISHIAPEWASRYKLVRKPTLLEYDIIDGFDNAYVVNDELYLEITSFTGVVPRQGDTMELFSEINTDSGDDPYVISQGNLTVPILRYVDDLESGTQSVSVELSDGTNTTRVDSQSTDSASPVPKGRYIVVNSTELENYSNTDVVNNTSRYTSSLFYIIFHANIEDQKLYQEIPGVWTIDSSGLHSGDTDQTHGSPAIVNLTDDFDIVWGQAPPREMFKYELTTNISNLGRPNAVSSNFREVDRFASLIVSEPFVDDTNFNGLSSFNLSLIPYKDLEKKDGQIQLINSEDTNVEVYQDNKVSRILYKKNVLTTATGDKSVSQTEDIWGEQIRSTSEYGMSHPESYSEWGNNRYYVDAERGVVLRKGEDGHTEVSAYGMLNFFHDILSENKNNRILGYYEPKYNNYAIVIGNEDHLLFAERSNGWESRLSFKPDKVVNDGLDVYSFDSVSRKFYKHDADSENWNRFYGSDYQTTVEIYFNDAFDVVKTINALRLNGDIPFSIQVITESQTSQIDGQDMEEVEGLLFSEVPLASGSSGRDYQFAGIVSENTNSNEISVDLLDQKVVHVGDTILKNGAPVVSLGICTEISDGIIALDSVVNLSEGDMLLALEEASSINGDVLKGRVIGIKVVYSAGSRRLLNSIELDVDESKQ